MACDALGRSVEVVTDSISESGKRITTLCLTQYDPVVTKHWNYSQILNHMHEDDEVITETPEEYFEVDLEWFLGEMKYDANLSQLRRDYKNFCISYAQTLYQNGEKIMANDMLLNALLCRRYVSIEDVDELNCSDTLKDYAQTALYNSEPKVLHHTEIHLPMYYGGVWSPHYEDDNKKVFDKHDCDWASASLVSVSNIGGGHQFQFSYNLNQWVGV